MKKNNSRIIIITGGSGDIGKAICTSFANPLNKIFFSYYSNEKRAKKIANILSQLGVKTSYRKVDVTSLKQVKFFIKSIIEECGKIDVLINNAGINHDGLIVRMSEQNWSQVINVNLKGTFNCTKVVSKFMLKQKYGRIINITSIVGITGNSGQSNYAASKAGIIGFTKSAAQELGPRNITVNAVAPGYINSKMTSKITETLYKKIIGKIPLGRAGIPEDVSNLVYFLASDRASYITGQVFNINGGMYM